MQRALLTLVENLQRQDTNCLKPPRHAPVDRYIRADLREEAANRLGRSPPLPTSCGCLSAARGMQRHYRRRLDRAARPSLSCVSRTRELRRLWARIEGA